LIKAAVRYETTFTKDWTLEDLKGGKGFESVHMTAMFLYVSASATATEETVPETLLFDVHRIDDMQLEYRRIVDGSTALVAACHATGVATAEQRASLAAIAEVVVAALPLDECLAQHVPSAADRDRILNPSEAVRRLM
jgi:hypothetical protein